MTKEPKQPGVTLGSQTPSNEQHFSYDEETKRLISSKLVNLASTEKTKPNLLEIKKTIFMWQIGDTASTYIMLKKEAAALPDVTNLISKRVDMLEKFTSVRDELCKHIDIDLWLTFEGDSPNLREVLCQLFLERRITFYEFSRLICHEVLSHEIDVFSEPGWEESIKEETKRSTKHRDEFLKTIIEAVASVLDKAPNELKIWEDSELVELLVLALEPPAKLVGDAFGSSTVYKTARKLMK